MARRSADPVDADVAYWRTELERAKSRYRTFWDYGDQVVDAYRLQKEDGNDTSAKDKYNILYSSTETIRPNLYVQTPRPRVVLRSKDTANDATRMAALLLEGCLKYVIDEEDLDDIMDGAVEDLLLPGMGQAWVRYDAKVEGDDTNARLLDEMVCLDYVYWQDFLTGVARRWKQVPWVAKRLWLNKEDAAKRFGKEKAAQLTYAKRDSRARELNEPGETAELWEIWDKRSRTVFWLGEGVPELLDKKSDPLKLKNFFPCPRPMRAIYNTRTIVPRALYSQYKSQADTLNVLTKRIRLLGEALRVVGLYDGSMIKLSDLLSPQAGNRMIPVDAWAAFAQNGGVAGAVQWLPIDQIAKVLNELLQAREVCKAEIYEITGFSDIVRGVSKASETLGAQNLKSNWASARVKKMQKAVQDFVRDILAITGEIIAEHCSPETIAMFSGIRIPSAEELQADPKLQQQLVTFKDACDLIRTDMRRVSSINIETDSTLAADDQMEKQERAEFLAAAGAFLQQAVPAIEAQPELGPLLGAMLMFTVRSFPQSRIVEDEFERLQQTLAQRGPQQQDGDKTGKKAAAAAQEKKIQADAAAEQAKLQQTAQSDAAKLALETTKENNRHAEKMAELALREREVEVKERELAVKEKNETFKVLHEAGMREEELKKAEADKNAELAIAADAADRSDANAEADREQKYERMDRTEADAEANREQEADRMDREDARSDADREAAERAKEAGSDGSEG